MIWIVLATIGLPLWLCAAGVIAVLVRNRRLRTRGDDVAVRRRSPGTVLEGCRCYQLEFADVCGRPRRRAGEE